MLPQRHSIFDNGAGVLMGARDADIVSQSQKARPLCDGELGAGPVPCARARERERVHQQRTAM